MARRDPLSPTPMPTILRYGNCSPVRSNRSRIGFLRAAAVRGRFDAVPVRGRPRTRFGTQETGPGGARNCPVSAQSQLLLPASRFFSLQPQSAMPISFYLAFLHILRFGLSAGVSAVATAGKSRSFVGPTRRLEGHGGGNGTASLRRSEAYSGGSTEAKATAV